MKQHYPLVVIGAGPAGLAAAVTAAGQGVEVALFDQQDAPGGQIYRGVESSPQERADQLGGAYRHGETLVRALRQSGAAYFADSQVWPSKPALSAGEKSREIELTQCRVFF